MAYVSGENGLPGFDKFSQTLLRLSHLSSVVSKRKHRFPNVFCSVATLQFRNTRRWEIECNKTMKFYLCYSVNVKLQ